MKKWIRDVERLFKHHGFVVEKVRKMGNHSVYFMVNNGKQATITISSSPANVDTGIQHIRQELKRLQR